MGVFFIFGNDYTDRSLDIFVVVFENMQGRKWSMLGSAQTSAVCLVITRMGGSFVFFVFFLLVFFLTLN